LRDGSVSSVRLNDVLFVPKLDRPLISWSKLSKLGCTLSSQGNTPTVHKGKSVIMHAVLDGQIYRVLEADNTHTAFSTYEFWHSALGHPAPATIDKSRQLLSNGNQIPPTPENFHCQPCILAKHTHKRPQSTSTGSQDTQRFQ